MTKAECRDCQSTHSKVKVVIEQVRSTHCAMHGGVLVMMLVTPGEKWVQVLGMVSIQRAGQKACQGPSSHFCSSTTATVIMGQTHCLGMHARARPCVTVYNMSLSGDH